MLYPRHTGGGVTASNRIEFFHLLSILIFALCNGDPSRGKAAVYVLTTEYTWRLGVAVVCAGTRDVNRPYGGE